MSNRIDQLFKKKLGDHRLPPSSEVWSKIESGLSKKNNTVILWRAAAVLILCGFFISAWFYWKSTQDRIQQLATQQVDTLDTAPKTQALIEAVDMEDHKDQSAVNNKSTQITRKKITSLKIEEAVNESTILKETETELIPVLESVSVETVAKAEKPIVIEFTLDPVPTSKLVAKATEVEKTNGLKKVLDKAIDLKNGEGDLGSLRDAKNELFALDFRKDKTKRN
jgi:hypothetical protein